MTREKRLAGRAIRKARREQRATDLTTTLSAMKILADAAALAFDVISVAFNRFLELLREFRQSVSRHLQIAADARARREFEWRLSFRALEAPRHDQR